jgi:hypothetical protein
LTTLKVVLLLGNRYETVDIFSLLVGTIDQRGILRRRRRLRAKTWRSERHIETHGTVGSWGDRAFLAGQRRARADLQRATACAIRHKRPAGICRTIRLAATRSCPPSLANATPNIESPRIFTRVYTAPRGALRNRPQEHARSTCSLRSSRVLAGDAARCLVNIVEYFEARKREIEEQLEAIESGRVIRLIHETKDGRVDVTEQEKQRLRQASQDYWRAAENLRRINSSQKLRG